MIYNNNMNNNKTLHDYCAKKKITIKELAGIVGIAYPHLYLIANNPKYNVRIETIRSIYNGTKKKYGKGLMGKDYLNFECFK